MFWFRGTFLAFATATVGVTLTATLTVAAVLYYAGRELLFQVIMSVFSAVYNGCCY